MSFGLVYWILMLLWAIFGVFGTWHPADANYRILGGNLLLFVLLVLLGWHEFGPPLHG